MKNLFKYLIIFVLLIISNLFITSCNSKEEDKVVLDKIELTNMPKTEYELNESLDVSGGELTVYYNNSTTKKVALTADMVTGFDSFEAKTVTLTINYSEDGVNKQTTYDIHVYEEIVLMSITASTKKEIYYENDEVLKSDLVVSAIYSNGSKKEINDYKIDKDKVVLGDTKITISYQGKYYDLKITVNEVLPTSLTIVKKPTKVEYYENDVFDPAGMEVSAKFNNGKEEIISGFDYDKKPLTLQDTTVTIYYQGKKTSLVIKVNKLEITNLKIVKNPDKLVYNVGDNFDPTGMVVVAVYNSLKEEAVDYVYDNYPLIAGQKSIEIKYQSFSTILSITVNGYEKNISKVELSTLPVKLNYVLGQHLDVSGGKLTITFSDESIQEVDLNLQMADKEIIDTANQKINLVYQYLDQEYKFSYDITTLTDYSVNKALKNVSDDLVSINGTFIGYAGNGNSSSEGLILQDPNTFDLIICHGAMNLNLDYQKGDFVRLVGKVVKGTNNKYSDYNMTIFSVDNSYYNEIISDEIILNHSSGYNLNEIDRININSQDDLIKALSTNKNDNFYKLFVVKGPIYFVQYASSGTVEEKSYFRLYLDSTYSELSQQKIDSLSPVIRNNYSSMNLGESFSHEVLGLSDSDFKTSSYEKPIVYEGNLVLLYVGGNNYYHQLVVLDQSMIIDNPREEITRDDYQDVIKAIAYSYYNQGTQIQYDQLNYRRHINPYPDMANDEEILYLDCSSYVNAVYYYAFGRNIVTSYSSINTNNFNNYSKENYGKNSDIIYYIDVNDYSSESKQTALLKEIKASLQVGDLVNYRHGKANGSSGHIMLYIGDDLFLHCTGTSFNYSNDGPIFSYDTATSTEASNGAIQLLNASEVFTNTASSRYLFRKTASDSVYSFSILRPLNQSGLVLTEQAKEKYYNQGLVFERSVDVKHYQSVNNGDTLTYNIEIENTSSSTLYGLNISDNLSDKTILVTTSINNDGSFTDTSVNWYLKRLNAGQKLTLTYQVIVKDNAQGYIETSGNVNGMPMNKTINTIRKIDQNKLEKIASTALSLVNSTAYDTGFMFVNDVYYKETGAKFSNDYNNENNFLADSINTTTGLIKEGTKASELVIKNLYGGQASTKGNLVSLDRTRRVLESYLSLGDIIILYDSVEKTYETYLYASSNTLVTVKDGKVTKVNIGTKIDHSFTTKLIGYNQFVVIRPSLK